MCIWHGLDKETPHTREIIGEIEQKSRDIYAFHEAFGIFQKLRIAERMDYFFMYDNNIKGVS